MTRAARAVLILSLALWSGGLATISFVVAPTAFRTAPTRKDAGNLVGATLRGFNKIEIACGVLSLAASALLFAKRPEGTKKGLVSVILVFVMLLVSVALMTWIYPGTASARSATDPAGQESFARMHQISVVLVSINIFTGAGLLICLGLRKTDGA